MGQSQSSRRTKAEEEQLKLENTTQVTLPKTTGPVPKPGPKFKIPRPLKEMMEAPAGRLPVAPTDDYVFLKYSKAASDICEAVQKFVVTFNEIKARYEDGKSINNNMLYRKDMACKGFKDVLFLKFCYENLLDDRAPQFDEVKKMIDKQIVYSTDLLDHVVKSFDRQNRLRYIK
ncbi:hypothetical protein GCK72_016326 [Caenorhabditis remanei]|uniref:Uncharacterized protein n=1 Tax=Caenorhabditis remanei TaxID=31234 RepID=A0A6A5GYU0_CAERE|nr:hypothetical protein GCK72_016326 [Caenorhabditis remanei]KAF1759859.1 hypothetical protein GCK72_016326 [Caenorhabditis remanei]